MLIPYSIIFSSEEKMQEQWDIEQIIFLKKNQTELKNITELKITL